MRFTTRLAKERPAIDMTPLVDVLFLLLIFFLVTSDTLPLKSIRIERPSLALEAPPIISQLPIVVDEQEVIYVGSKRSIVAAEELLAYLQQEVDQYRSFHQGEPTLVFSVDRRVPYELFLQLFATAQSLKLPIRLAYREASDAPH